MKKKKALYKTLEDTGLSYRRDVSLASFLSMKTGGPAWAFFCPETKTELQTALHAAKCAKVDTLILGGGANLLVRDQGFFGLALQLGKSFATFSETPEKKWHTGAALPLSRLVERATKEAREDFAFLGGIPGTLGGAVVMNAGTELGDISCVVESVNILLSDGKEKLFLKNEMDFQYRHSALPPGAIVLGATLLPGNIAKDPDAFRQLMKKRAEKRRKNQPIRFPTSGSTFKNPKGDYAGRLLEAAGLKGKRIGGAEISSVHANFIVNPERRATTGDVLALIEYAQKTVCEKFAIFLELEVRVIGAG